MPKAKTKAPKQTGSTPTYRYLLCPRSVDLHPQLLTACMVMRGPKTLHLECSVCGDREIISPKLLKAADTDKVYGLTLEEVLSRHWIPQPA